MKLVADKSYVRVRLSEFWLAADRSRTFAGCRLRPRLGFSSASPTKGRQAPRTGETGIRILIKPDAVRVSSGTIPSRVAPYQGQQVDLEPHSTRSSQEQAADRIDILSDFASLVTPLSRASR